jgi:hypothetical protein
MQTKSLSHIEICDLLTAIRLKLGLLRCAVHGVEDANEEDGISSGYDLIHWEIINSLKIAEQSIISLRRDLNKIHELTTD